MKCQILFSGKKEKTIINLSSPEFAHSMISVKNIPYLSSVAFTFNMQQ